MLSFRDIKLLRDINCPEKTITMLNRYKSLYNAWNESVDSRWMLDYVYSKKILDEKTAIQLSIIFAERVLYIWEEVFPKNKAPHKAIKAAKRWLQNPTEENVDLADAAAMKSHRLFARGDESAAALVGVAAAQPCNIITGFSHPDVSRSAINATDDDPDELKFQADTVREFITNPFKFETERLDLDKDTAEPWKDILEEL